MSSQKLAEVSARIFGNIIGNGLRSGRKLLSRPLVGEKVVAWYPKTLQENDALFEDPAEKR
jgi:small subunit ribosomal protein S33